MLHRPLHWLGTLTLLSAPLACLPDTDLEDERSGAAAGTEPAAPGPTVGLSRSIQLVQPTPGAADVPLNLSALLVRSSQPLAAGSSTPFALRAQGGPELRLDGQPMPCATEEAAACYRLAMAAPLLPATGYELLTAAGVSWADGTTVEPSTIARFQTAAAPDTRAPVLAPVQVGGDECLSVLVAADEPVTVSASFQIGDALEVVTVADSAPMHHLLLPLASLPAATSGSLLVTVSDAAGNVTASAPLAFVSPPAAASLVVSEVLANPAGSEYTQEYVELVNAGPSALSLGGFTIADGAGVDTLPDVTMAPGQRLLIVAANFDAATGPDPLPPPDAVIVRVEGRIGRDGLANGGEPVLVRDPSGRKVAGFPGHIDMSRTAWNGKSAVRTGLSPPCDDPALWSPEPAVPTPGF